MRYYNANTKRYVTTRSKKPYKPRTKFTKTKSTYKKPPMPMLRTNDKHFDEKIAKTDMILNQISHGMNVLAAPVKGAIALAEQYAGGFFKLFKK